jgi:ubiquinone/menaquinone biosynthesis C-methylase UbiE
MEKFKNEFDEKAKAWDDNPERVARSRTIAEAIIKEIPIDPSFTAMEYGCGTGLLSFPLRNKFSKITLVDNSKGMLDVLKEKIIRSAATNMEVLNADFLDSSQKLSSTFSVIYSAMVLHHIDDISKILLTWRSILKTPGYLCIADLDSDGGMFHGSEFKGHNGFDRNDLKKNIENVGFTEVRFKTVGEITKEARDGIVRSFPLFLMVCKKR